MGDLLDAYVPTDAFDEMLSDIATPREAYATLVQRLQTLSRADLDDRCEQRDRAFRDQGITFGLDGGQERPFPLDLIPRIITGREWKTIDAGVRQRVRALEAFLDDVYGAQHIIRDKVVPHRMVATSEHFHRSAVGITPAHGVRVHVAGVDLVRDGSGAFRVLEDNLRCPSGSSYVVENRRAMTRVFPEFFQAHDVEPVADYPTRLLRALRAAAPRKVARNPTIVVLTPGVYNSAYFEHSFLARQMGVELVEGRDLRCRDQVVYMRTTSGEQRVDVVYRRIDDDFLDPVHFRPDSVVGCPGIMDAARAGNVTIANMVGNGVADDKAIYCFVPAMIEYYLGEAPILDNVMTYRLESHDVLDHCLNRIDRLVWKPVDGSGGYGIVIGHQADDATLATLRTAVTEHPRGWIAQEPVALSTAPTFVDGILDGRHVDLRPFAVNDGEHVWVAPGGLTRVALPKGSLVVNSSQGGGSKDTWVLKDCERPARTPITEIATPNVQRTTAVEALTRIPQDEGPYLPPAEEQHQQQQQQQQALAC